MLCEPVLLLPAFRSGRETPWAGDILRRCYEKYTLGNQIGESYDFSLLPHLESTAPDDEKLSSVLQRADITPEQVPFLTKWVDAEKPMSIHVHPHDEYVIVLRTRVDARLFSFSNSVSKELLKESLLTENADHLFSSVPLSCGDAIYIPAGVPHALQGVTCYQIQHPGNGNISYRVYDWNRLNARGQKQPLQLEHALPLLSEKAPVFLSAHDDTVLQADSFFCKQLKNVEKYPLNFVGRFAVLTCLEASLIQLANGRHLYLSAGQTLFLPNTIKTALLTSPHCLLTISQE